MLKGRGGTAESVAEEGGTPLWRNRDYSLLLLGQVLSVTGSGITGIAIPLLILAITSSPAAAGIAGALYKVPYLVLSLPVGALIDRWDRKRVMIICDSVRVLNMVSVAVAMLLGIVSVWHLYLVVFIDGTGFVFFNIAQAAALPRLVKKEQLPEATAQSSVANSAAFLVGPPLGGFLYQSVGRLFPFLFDGISYLASVITLVLIRKPFQEARITGERRDLRAEIAEGVRWLWRQPVLRFMAFLTGGYNLVLASLYLLIILLAQARHASEAEIGIIFSIGAAGGIVGALIGGKIQKRFTFGQAIIGIMWVLVALFPLLALAPNFIALAVVWAFLSVLVPVYNVVQFSYRLALIPDKLQGRVNSSFRLVGFGFQPLGSLLAGFVAEIAGPDTAIWLLFVYLIGLSMVTTLNKHVRTAPPIEQSSSAH
jgi:MFS family permease